MAEKVLKKLPNLDQNCMRKLGSGSSSDAFKVCHINTNCTKCFIAKVGHKPDYIDPVEAAISKHATEAVKGTDYEHLVPKFWSYGETKDGIQILSSVYTDNYGDMVDFMKTKWAWLSVPQFASLLVEIFCTLDFLFKKIGVIHMDLKLENVLIINGTFNRVLTFGDGKRAILPVNMRYSAMVIDYGNAYSWKDSTREFKGEVLDNSPIYGSESEFKGACYFSGFDVFRFFYNLSVFEPYMNASLLKFWHELKKKVFSGFYDELVKVMNPAYSMLSREGCFLSLIHI
jgi:serine/threonine protein kinase